MNFNSTTGGNSQSIDIKSLARTYTKKWRWFLLSLLVALTASFLIVRYSPAQYAAQAKIQILEDQSSNSELGLFQDLEVFSGSNTRRIEDQHLKFCQHPQHLLSTQPILLSCPCH